MAKQDFNRRSFLAKGAAAGAGAVALAGAATEAGAQAITRPPSGGGSQRCCARAAGKPAARRMKITDQGFTFCIPEQTKSLDPAGHGFKMMP